MRFAGYAALFDVVDRGGDVVRRGAFGRALAGAETHAGLPAGTRKEARAVPLLWQHDPARPIGVIERAEEDARGLRVVARLSDASVTAKEAAALIAEGAVSGLSFGYRVRASEAGPVGRGGAKTRALTAVELVEVSVVTLPMQPGARVIAVQE